MENGDTGSDVAEKPARGGRKHSLPQQLDTVGVRQVAAKFSSLLLIFCLLQAIILDIVGVWYQFHVL